MALDFGHVVFQAERLWSGFAQEYSATADFELFSTLPSKPSLVFYDFLEFCANIFSDGEPAPQEISILQKGRDTRLDGQRPSEHGRAVSWLMVNGGAPQIVIDSSHLGASVPSANLGRARNQLVLHELGHLVFHWGELTANVAGFDLAFVDDALAHQEREAWWFSMAIIGYSIGRIAHSTKRTPQQAWQILWGGAVPDAN